MEINKENYFYLKGQKLTRLQIAKTFGISESMLKRRISKEGWGAKKPTVCESCFSELTSDSCYWAGFIAADGCVKNDGTLTICLNYDDTAHLEKFKEYCKSTHKITSNTEKYYRSEISFKRTRISEDLYSNFNITPRKSLTYKMPTLPPGMMRHFLRGYFDGDGCICESFSNKNSKTATLYTTVTGSQDFIKSLEHFFVDTLGIKGSVSTKINKGSTPFCTVKYNTTASKILLEYLYKDCKYYLDRKKKLYDTIVVSNIRTTR